MTPDMMNRPWGALEPNLRICATILGYFEQEWNAELGFSPDDAPSWQAELEETPPPPPSPPPPPPPPPKELWEAAKAANVAEVERLLAAGADKDWVRAGSPKQNSGGKAERESESGRALPARGRALARPPPTAPILRPLPPRCPALCAPTVPTARGFVFLFV